MAATEDGGRISVSKDFLRAELGAMELRLIQNLATQAEVEGIRKDVEGLKRWRAYVAGVATTAAALASAAVAIALHPWH